MKIRTITITAIAIAALALPCLVSAQGYGGHGNGGFHGKRGGGGMGPDFLLGRLGDKLDLSDDQRSQIEAIIDASKEQTVDLREQLDSIREDFRETRQPGEFNEEEIRAFAAAKGNIQTELMVIKMKSHADIFAVLTPDQQQEFIELRELMREGRGNRGPRGGCGGRGGR